MAGEARGWKAKARERERGKMAPLIAPWRQHPVQSSGCGFVVFAHALILQHHITEGTQISVNLNSFLYCIAEERHYEFVLKYVYCKPKHSVKILQEQRS